MSLNGNMLIRNMSICCRQTALETLKVNVDRISMCDYEQHHYDKELLKQAGLCHYSITNNAQIMRMICLYHFYSIFLPGIGNFKSVGNAG